MPYQCQKCNIVVEGGKRTQTKRKMCHACYLKWERERHKKISQRKSKQKRTCPECGNEHQSPGYCYSRCLSCHQTNQKKIQQRWRSNNPIKATERTIKWQKENRKKHLEYNKKWAKEIRTPRAKQERNQRKRLMATEKGGKCAKCGYSKNYAALVFHHKDPTIKNSTITEMIRINSGKLKAELSNCLLLCSNCHCELHSSSPNSRESKIKLRFVAEAGAHCQRCGYARNIDALLFHHLDPSTKIISIQKAIRQHNVSLIKEELKKCILLCSNCHAEIHHPDLEVTSGKLG